MANYNPNLVKIHRSYTFEELAAVFGVHKNTVSAWVKNGLPCLKEQKPFLILGSHAKAYLQTIRTTRKQKCKPDELFCMRCKAPTKPAENYVEYLPISATKGRLSGFCSCCETVVNKFIGIDDVPRYALIFDMPKPRAWQHLNDSSKPLLNSDLKK